MLYLIMLCWYHHLTNEIKSGYSSLLRIREILFRLERRMGNTRMHVHVPILLLRIIYFKNPPTPLYPFSALFYIILCCLPLLFPSSVYFNLFLYIYFI